jgi:cellulose synthase/poly-beta-1,6-N-acetylglucosamine synthase-like glycosyltransferase
VLLVRSAESVFIGPYTTAAIALGLVGSAYIAESIASVLTQTYEDYELIVCDNCSTDDTEEIVRSFHDRRIRFVASPTNIASRLPLSRSSACPYSRLELGATALAANRTRLTRVL